MLFPRYANGQTKQYSVSNSALNVGNPGGVFTSADYQTYSSYGFTNIMTYRQGLNGATSTSYNPANYWSLAQGLPFTFEFYGTSVDSFCVAKNGLLTFSTGVAGSAVNTALNTNSVLPNSNLPDSTIAYFWENNATSARGSNDVIATRTVGTAPNRQLWIAHYSYRHGSMSFSYFALVLEETSNKIYVVDMNYKSGNGTMTVGTQLNSCRYTMVETGLHGAGSPNIVFGSGSSGNSDNEYYTFTPVNIVSNDLSMADITNPGNVACNTSDSIKVRVANVGSNSITSFSINYSVDGVAQTAHSYSGSLGVCADTVINLGSHTYSTSLSQNIKAYTSSPNGGSDGNNNNDTLTKPVSKGLSGSYTVGGTSPDYTTLGAAISDLESYGVCGPVVFNIRSGTYTGQNKLTSFVGGSTTNTVTFQSATGNAADVKITNSSTTSTDRYTLQLHGSSYVILKNLTIEGTNTSYAWALQLRSCNNITVKRCVVRTNYSGTSTNFINLCVNGNASGYSTGAVSNNITVDSCTFENSGYSVTNYGGGTTSLSDGFVFTNNTISGGYYGLRAYYHQGGKIHNNTIVLSNNAWAGIYLSNFKHSATKGPEVTSNIVRRSYYYGIYMTSCDNTSANRGLCANNMISDYTGTPTYYGIYNSSSDYWNYYHNSVRLNPTTSSTARCMYISSANYTDVRNNIFAVISSVTSTNHQAYYNSSSPSTTRTLDYNNYYSPNCVNLIYSGGNRTTAQLNTYSTSGDVNSTNVEPPFVSQTDLSLTDGCFEKAPLLAGAGTDKDGETRLSSTHMGADQVQQFTNDVGIVSVYEPMGTVSPGSQTVKAVVKNFGSNTIVGYTAHYQVGSSTAVSQPFPTNTVASCATDSITFGTTFTHSAGCTGVRGWANSPGSSTDNNPGNDTSGSTSFGVALSGTYTIGGTSGNFSTFNEAVAALECAGVSGPVVFDVASGTYTENITLETQPGMSSTNTVTFRSLSTNTTMPLIQFSGPSSGNKHTIKFNNAKYFVIDGLHIKGLNSSYARVIAMTGTNGDITIKNCKIEAPNASPGSSNVVCLYDNSGSANQSTNMTITDNEFMYGTYGIYAYGASTTSLQGGWKINDNTFTDFSSYGVYMYNCKDAELKNNKISSASTYTTNKYGMYLRYVDGANVVTGNSITGFHGGTGIYAYYNDATSGSPSLIANNMIAVGSAGNTARGIYIGQSKYMNIYHNTVKATSTSTSTTNAALYLYNSSSIYTGVNVMNNVFTKSQGVVLYIYDPTYVATMNNNVYHTTGSSQFYKSRSPGTTYGSLSGYQTAYPTKDVSSRFESVLFKGSNDLHLVDPCFGKVSSLASVTTDIDGDTRGGSTTYPGADVPPNGTLDVGVVEVIEPNGVLTAGAQTVRIAVRNYGTTAITQYDATYAVGATTNTETFTRSVASCALDTVTFLNSFNISAGCISIKANTSLPNGLADQVASNDEGPENTIGVPMAGGTYTIGGTGADFTTFKDAIDAMACAGIAGPVVLDVASGTYNEQVLVTGITGTSATNTITFRSKAGNTTMPVVEFAGTSAKAYTIKVEGVQYVTFDGLHLKALNETYQRIINLQGNNSYFTVTNCKLEGIATTSTSNARAIIYDWSGTDNISNNVTISNNQIMNGSFGIYNYGNNTISLQNNWTITNNKVTGYYYMGIYNYYQSGLTCSKNTITTSSVYSTLYGIYTRYCDGGMKIMQNNVNIPRGYAYYGYYNDATSTTPSVISNNFFRSGSGVSSTNTYAVYSYYSKYQKFYHNTCRVFNSNTSSTYAGNKFYYTSSVSYPGNELKNNIFTNESGGWVAYFYNTTYMTTDHNAFYGTRTTSKYYMAFSSYSTLAAYKTGKGSDLNSVEAKPNFTGTGFEMNQGDFYGAGDSLGVTVDVDGNTRSLSAPTIGAQELMQDVNVSAVAVSDTVCGTSNPTAQVSVTFKNESDFDMNAATFNVSVDGGTPVQGTVAGPFLQGITYTRTLPITVDLSGTTANVVKVEHAGGDVDASDNSATTTVPYWPNPVSSFTQADSCLGDNMSFTNTSSISSGSITATSWKFGDGNTSTATSPSNMYATSGSYSVTISSTSNNGCRDTVVQSVNVLTELMAGSITGDSSICYSTASGVVSEVTAASGSAGTYQYQWQSSADNATWSDISGATSASYTPGVLTSTTYYRRAVTTNVGCGPSYTSSVKVTVYDKLVAGTIGSNQTICYNTTPASIGQTATPIGGDGTWTYQWEESTNGTTWMNIAGATNTSYVPGNLKTTTYYRLMATGGKSCGMVTSNTITITVYDDLTAGVVGNDHSVCPQSPADAINQTVTPTGGDGTYTYQWQESTDKITWTNVTGATSANFNSTTGITVRTYYRRNTTSGSGCGTVATNDVNVSIAPLPVSSFIVANHCFNDVMPVTNNSSVTSGSLTGFSWDFGDSNTSTARIPAHVYSSSGLKTVKLKVTTNIGCVDSSTNVVNVSNVPTPAFSTVYDCDAESMRFKNATSVNCGKISAFYWEFGDGTTSTMQNPTHKYTSSGTYSVKFKIFLPGGFEDSTTRSIVIADRAGSDFTADDECFGDSVRFVNSSTNATAYLWDFDDNNTSSLENPVHFYRVVGTYDVQLVAVDGNGCNDTTVKSVTVKVKPSVYFTGDDRCVDESVPFNNGTIYAHSYAWDFGDNTTSTSSASSFNKAYSTDGSFTTKLVAYNNNGCRDSFSSTIVVHPNPVAGFTISDMCSNDALNISNTSTGHLISHWDMGDMSTFTSSVPPSSFRYKAGTYNVTLTVASVYGCEDVDQNSVVVYDSPNADFTAPAVCAGNATSFTNVSTGGSGTVTYNWNFGDGNTSTAMSPSHTYAASGIYQATLTVTGQGNCTSTVTKTVTVWAAPTASVSVTDVCVGNTSVFAATTTGASTYNWNFGDGNSSTSPAPTHRYATAGSYAVTLKVTTINGCEVTANATAVVNDKPVTSFTASTECLGSATTFTNNSTVGSGTLTYAWNFGDGNTSTSASPTHTYGTAGTYTAELTATANGCSSSYSTSVTVNDKPNADFTGMDVCIDEVTTFTNYSGGASSYTWSFGDGNTSNVHSPNHTYASAGTYSVTLTAMNASGCSDAVTKTVTVRSKQTAAFSVNNVCEDATAAFTNNSGRGTYLWSFGDGGVSTQANPAYVYTNDGTYTVSLKVTSANGCESTTSSSITVYDAPIANFADVMPCQNETVTFTNSSTGANSYTWNFGDGSADNLDQNPTYTYSSPGSYNVSLRVGNTNGCTHFVQRTITVSPLPKVSFTATDACEGSAVQFTNFSSQGANTWTYGDGAGSSLTNPAHLYASTGAYPVTLSVTTAEGCTAAITKSVNVHSNPVASFTVAALCTGTNVDLTNTSTISAGSIVSRTWNYGDGDVGTANVHSYGSPGVYQITVTVTSDKGCTASTTSPIEVYNAPTADFSARDVCFGQGVVFMNNSNNTSSTNWAFGDGAISTVISPTHMYSSPGAYNVTLNTENPLGCTAQATRSVNVNANPSVGFDAPNGCNNADIQFTNMSSGGATNAWDFGDGTSSTDADPTHMYGSSGNKVVMLTVTTDKGCVGEATKTITVHTSPTAAFTAVGTCEGDATQFVNTSQNGNAFAWSFGDGNVTTDANPTNTYSVVGDFRALLIVSNANCSDSAERTVSINPLPNSGFTFTTSGREVTFTPSAAGEAGYAWNFGDGNSSTDEAPVHRYAGAVNETFKACLSLTDNNGCMSETCNDVAIDLVSTNDLDQVTGLQIYPNPNKGNFAVVIDAVHGDIELDLYDARGVHVSKIDTSTDALKYNVDVRGIAEGVYFIRLKNGTYTSTQRMVITR